MPIALILSMLPVLAKLAPDLLGLFFGGKAGDVAARVGQAASDIFGTQDAEAVTHQIATDPAKADAFATRLQAETDQLKAGLADAQNARGTMVALAQAGSQIAWGAPVVSVAVTLGFIAIVGVMTVHAIPDSAVVNVLVGTLATAFGAVVNYWLGSSAGSRAKDDHLADLARAPTVNAMPGSRVL